MAYPSLEIEAYHQAIMAFLGNHFPEIETFGTYERLSEKIITPACLVQISDFEPNNDAMPADGRLAMNMQINIILIADALESNIRMNLRILGTNIASKIHQQRFGCTTPFKIKNVFIDPFDGQYDPYEVLKIEAEQTAYFGTIEADDGIMPQTVFVGITPNIGLGNEEDYINITDAS